MVVSDRPGNPVCGKPQEWAAGRSSDRDQLESVAEELLKVETLDAATFNHLIGRPDETGNGHSGVPREWAPPA